MRSVFLLICSVFFFSAYCQKAPVKFGDVSLEELKMVSYDKDTSASAVILADYGVTSMGYQQGKNFFLKFDRIVRIKILKKNGYDFASREIALYHIGEEEEKLQSLKAITYNLEKGKIVESKMNSDGLFKEKYDKNIDLIKFTLPDVKVGSVIEISYQIFSDFIFNLQDWEFQSTIPVKWSEYRVSVPEYFNYNQLIQGYVRLVINENSHSSGRIRLSNRETSNKYDQPLGGGGFTGGSNTVQYQDVDFINNDSRFVAQNVPAFRGESHMNNLSDYISKINFELAYTKFPNSSIKNYSGSWESLNKSFLEAEDFGQMLKGSNFLNEQVRSLTEGVLDPFVKASRIYQYVKENVQWNGDYRKYTENTFRKILDNKKGNSADINLLLVAMLRKAELNANPVLISTRNHGFVRESSALSTQFNYVSCVLKIDKEIIVIDATDPLLPINILPERCLNGKGWIVSETDSGWITIAPNFKSKTVVNGSIELDRNGALKADINFIKEGYDARSARSAFLSKGEEDYSKNIKNKYLWDVDKSSFENMHKLSSAVKESYSFTVSDAVQAANDIYYFNPMLVERMEENPFRSDTREYPVDFGSPYEKTVSYKIKIPSDLVVEELPKPKILILPDNAARFIYSATQIENSITFTSQLSVNKSIFVQSEYAALKQFFDQIVAKQSEQIVLKKK